MNTQPDFSPIGELASSTQMLKLDYGEQQCLSHEMLRAANDIGSVPGLEPDQTDVSLSGIRLKTSLSASQGQKPMMSVAYSETNNGLKGATISIIADNPKDSKRLHLAPEMDIWEEWHPGSVEAAQYLTHDDLITMLSTRLPNERSFESILDRTDLSGMEIAHLLADHLKSPAAIKKRTTRLGTNTIIAGHDFLSRSETRLTIEEANNRRTHRLAVGAIYSVGLANIQKKYAYTVKSTERLINGAPAQTIKSAAGDITFSSTDGVPPSRLDFFAKIDQEKNDPITVFHRGLIDLRKQYGVSER
ncbi:hypothetical protein H7X68_00900 [Candidatus Saccharibacteria bacterium]|nr:hypothetical protein [Candidatus Saccharibacteria bacterium]